MHGLRGALFGLASLAGIGAAFVPAIAADKGPRYAPPPPPSPPPFSSIWQGLYGGVHLGIGDSGDGSGAIGGVQLGYNWQANRIVYGIEGDLSLADIETRHGDSIDWLGSVRGRLGYLLDPRLLAYATAGVGTTGDGRGGDAEFVYGMGVEGKFSELTSLRVEYLHYNDADADIVRAGLNFKLGR
jgi:outer membrane immunogenic protein